MNKQIMSDFVAALFKGAKSIVLFAVGVAAIAVMIFATGCLLPDLAAHWPLQDLPVADLSSTSRCFVNGLAWLAWGLVSIALLMALARLGGFDPAKYDQKQS